MPSAVAAAVAPGPRGAAPNVGGGSANPWRGGGAAQASGSAAAYDYVEAGGSGVLAVEGVVTIANLPNEMRRVSIQWRVRDAEGTELGRVDMTNPVPLALIERQWSELAFEIAAASADGIRDIAERHRVRAP